MNFKIIGRMMSWILLIEAVFMLPPALVSVLYGEYGAAMVFLFCTALTAGVALIMYIPCRKAPTGMLARDGLVCVGLSWIALSLFGCLPFWLSGEIPVFIDALFEIVSGFTTTGASILVDVERLSHGMLYWRSFTHWLGGMGVLVFLLAIVPMSGGSNINLMRAESPGPSVGKLVPKMVSSARILYGIYFGLTLLEIVLLILGGMPLFDSVATGFGTAGTGGFGIKADSFGSYAVHLQWIVTIFMILFGVNFNAYYFILFRQFRKAFGMEEVRTYFVIIIAAVAFITCNIRSMCSGVFDALTQAAFQVGSIITTTGFATTNFDLWPKASQTILVMLMFCGACAGSTGGGIKVSRFVIAGKTVVKEMRSYIHPKIITKVKMDGKPIEHEVVRATNVYVMTFVVIFTASVFAISFEGHDLVTNFTAVAATVNNIGPGLSMVGPAANFNFFSPFSKYVLMFDMLAGRLELFPLLILFHPTIWHELCANKIHQHRTAKERRREKKQN